MRIPCPCCGPRAMAEFSYGGADLSRPVASLPLDAPSAPDAEWNDYVYRRDNPAGAHRELWFHAAGCRRWFVARRDTRTNDFLSEAGA
ncbi:sarcosine oxidase subunit delta [Ancylobacter amanitiformis]|nr:sarcosine oxidase subunit delta [Ancylobacter amanitiformis]